MALKKAKKHKDIVTIILPRTSCIYFLPKIHKPNNSSRLIFSACSCPTKLISSYLNKIISPIIKTSSSYIKDSQHMLEIFCEFNFFGRNKLVFTMDITSLYTNFPNDGGLQALKHLCNQGTGKEPRNTTPFSRTSPNTQLLFIQW